MAIGKKAALSMAVGGILASGVSQAAKATGAQDAFYATVLGDPNIDKYVMGSDVPLMGGVFAAPVMSQMWGRNKYKYINGTTIGSHSQYQKMPRINGNVVFGMHNSRMA